MRGCSTGCDRSPIWGVIGESAVLGAALAALGLLLVSANPIGVLMLSVGTLILARGMAGKIVSAPLAALLAGSTLLATVVMLAFVAGGGQELALLWLLVPYGPSWLAVAVSTLRGPVQPDARAAP